MKTTTHIALLRAVNVGGRGKIAMADLRDLATGLGLEEVRTLLQSGNLVFRAGAPTTTTLALEKRLESATFEKLELRTDYFVRTAKEWATLVAANPFPAEAERDPGHLVVLFLKEEANATSVATLQAAIKGREIVRAKGRQLYIVYPDGIGESRLTNKLIESKLGASGTGRNWNTVLKLAAAVGS